jgi:hypothetical protein
VYLAVSRNYIRMRPTTFDVQTLRKHLLVHKIADLPELCKALGGAGALTVFRKLKSLRYLSSYTHRGRFYSLPEIARFDEFGLWTHDDVWFSSRGTLVDTLESWVLNSIQGWFADELAAQLHVEVQDPLRELVRQGRLRRSLVDGRFLYTAPTAGASKDQLRTRSAYALPLAVNATGLLVSPDELKAAIVLFYSLLDEQQRRLFAGLESIRLGHGGDTILAGFLQLDAHTVARGRQQLLDHDVTSGRTRRQGGGRPSIEKKAPKSSL